MRIIGITGGIGSGKTEILNYLQDTFHAHTIQLDTVAKSFYQPGNSCYDLIVTKFGKSICNNEGKIDKEKLAKLIYDSQEQRVLLNSIVHPAVKQWIIEDISRCREAGVSLYVVEAALLIEDNYSVICDELWYIYVDAFTRVKRLQSNRGYAIGKIHSIMESQLSDSTYRKACDRVIDNSGDFENTKKQINRLLKLKLERIPS